MQKEFARQLVEKAKNLPGILGIAVGGSWITNELDQYSDLDFVIVTHSNDFGSEEHKIDLAKKLGNFIHGFTGEHVGEPRLLICLYDDPLIHVDLKFVTLEEFKERVENPVILLDKEEVLKKVIETTEPHFPEVNLQWIEDRFWIWVHYAALKIGRGELFEALDFLSFLRLSVFGPLLQLKNGQLPKGVRKVEFNFSKEDQESLISTVSNYDRIGILTAVKNAIKLYHDLRNELYPATITINPEVEKKCIDYLDTIQA